MPIELRDRDQQPVKVQETLDSVLRPLNGCDHETAMSILLTATSAVMDQMPPHFQLSAAMGVMDFAKVMSDRSIVRLEEEANDSSSD